MNPLIPQLFNQLLDSSGLKSLTIKGKTILPIVQGGMGVGVSAHRLAGAVAKIGGMGTISSIDLRRLHPDLMDLTQHLPPSVESKKAINQANLEALKREIKMAQEGSSSFGLIAVNVMRAVNEYAPYVQCSLENGVDALVVGAGLPLDLPDLASDFPDVALIPILSESRGIHLLLRKWEKKGRLPDAIIIEHPRLAGGHVGAASIEDIHNPKFNFENVITVLQRDEIIGVPDEPSSYSEVNYSQEKYAKGIGLIYRKFFHSEYQPNNGGYFADGSYGVTYTIIDHN